MFVRSALPPVPRQEVPPPGQPPCIFCSTTSHFSAECDVCRHLSMRVDLLVNYKICTICLRRHYGDCIRADGCGLCGEPTHHQAICITNLFVVNDIACMAPRFYANIASASYLEIPPGGQQRPPHVRRRPRSVDRRSAQEGRDRRRTPSRYGHGQKRERST
ncbi:hypothetical protein V3C99_010615, partial [Haemonchus contortus]